MSNSTKEDYALVEIDIEMNTTFIQSDMVAVVFLRNTWIWKIRFLNMSFLTLPGNRNKTYMFMNSDGT